MRLFKLAAPLGRREFDFSLTSNKENRKAIEENSELFNKLMQSEDIKASVQDNKVSQSTGLMKSIIDTQINSSDNPNTVGVTGTFGVHDFSTDRSSKRLDVALKRLSEYNRELSRSRHLPKDSGYKLVGTLESELADIISLLQGERVAQSEEIVKLNAEIHKLNKKVHRQSKDSTMGNAIYNQNKECYEYKNQVLKLQEKLKQRDRVIEEIKEKCEVSERECEKLQAEVFYLKGILNTRENEQTERRDSEAECKKNKQLVKIIKEKNREIAELRKNLDNLKTERRSDNNFIGKRQSVEKGEQVFEELISKMQSLEDLITKNSSKYLEPYGKEDKIANEIRELKDILMNIEQRHTSQSNCTRNLQDSILICYW